MVVGREEESAALVGEVREHHLDELAREGEIARAPAGLQQLEQAVRQEHVVIEISGEARAPVLVRGAEAPVAPDLRANEVDGARGRFRQLRPRQPARGTSERAEHEPVPRHEHLLVAPRPNPLLARGEQLRACVFEMRSGLSLLEAE